MPRNISDMNDSDFDRILETLVGQMTASEILSFGDVYSILREELNNQVLEIWENA